MKLADRYRHYQRRLHRMLVAPGNELDRGRLLLRNQITLWRFCLKQLRRNNSLAMSAALSFRTIFALVPIMVLAMLVLKSTGQFEESYFGAERLLSMVGLDQLALPGETAPRELTDDEERLRQMLEGLTPEEAARQATQDTGPKPVSLAEYIQTMIDRVEEQLTIGRLGPIGAVMLIWTALTLLTTLERSLNRIFEARQSRPIVQRLLIYWSVVTLGPLLFSTAMYLGRQATDFVSTQPLLSWTLAIVGWLGPVLVMLLSLAAIYALMPNTKVTFKAAMAGAMVALPVWLIAEWGFSFYVSEVVARKSLYGSLGLIPIFLLWLNLSWTIILFGAEVAHTVGNLRRMQSEELAGTIVIGPLDRLAAAVIVASTYMKGEGPVTFDDIAERLDLPPASVHWVIDRLVFLNVLSVAQKDGREAYLPERPPERIGVLDVMEVDPGDLAALTSRHYADDITGSLQGFLNVARSRIGSATLADVVARKTETG